MLAQYSVPFSVALSVYRDPRDPRSFDESAVRDPDICSLAQRVTISAAEGQASGDLASTLTITLKDGREFTHRVTGFRGTPERPLDQAGLREKFMLLTQRLGRPRMEQLFERLQQVEMERDLNWIRV